MDAGSEIRSFFSIKEMYSLIDEEIASFKATSEEYSLRLGTFLRDSEGSKENAEWVKKMTALQGASKTNAKAQPSKDEKKDKDKNKDKNNKKGNAQNVEDYWIQFKEIKLNSTEKGEAEILFEITGELNSKLEKLERVKASLAELEKAGLGNDVIFIAYLHEGVPEKIVLRHKKEGESSKKFSVNVEFSIIRLLQSIPPPEGA